VFRGMAVPEVLLSGNHQAIARWRREQSEARSRRCGESGRQTQSQEGNDHEE
jgi:tRNA (guanine37-N1)-methyltransferase